MLKQPENLAKTGEGTEEVEEVLATMTKDIKLRLLAAAAGFDLVHQVGGDLTPRPQVLHQVHVIRSEIVNDFFLLHGVTATWALTEQVDLVTTETLKNNTDNKQVAPCLEEADKSMIFNYFLVVLLAVYLARCSLASFAL